MRKVIRHYILWYVEKQMRKQHAHKSVINSVLGHLEDWL